MLVMNQWAKQMEQPLVGHKIGVVSAEEKQAHRFKRLKQTSVT